MGRWNESVDERNAILDEKISLPNTKLFPSQAPEVSHEEKEEEEEENYLLRKEKRGATEETQESLLSHDISLTTPEESQMEVLQEEEIYNKAAIEPLPDRRRNRPREIVDEILDDIP